MPLHKNVIYFSSSLKTKKKKKVCERENKRRKRCIRKGRVPTTIHDSDFAMTITYQRITPMQKCCSVSFACGKYFQNELNCGVCVFDEEPQQFHWLAAEFEEYIGFTEHRKKKLQWGTVRLDDWGEEVNWSSNVIAKNIHSKAEVTSECDLMCVAQQMVISQIK